MRAILTWHSIDDSGSPISVSPAEWRRQVAWLAGCGARVVPLETVARAPGTDPLVALTFDDGFANFETDALPVLRDHGFPATLFIVTGHVGGDNRWAGRSSDIVPRLPLLGWDALARLPADLVAVGAHSHSHPRLGLITDPARLAEELEGASALIAERLGRVPDAVAYPYGSWSPATLEAAARRYRWGCTTELRALRVGEHPLALPRIDVHYLRAPDRLGRWGSARLRAWLGLRRAGRAVRGRVIREGAA